jgi:hypothetical protein
MIHLHLCYSLLPKATFSFCFKRPRAPNNRELSKQFENRSECKHSILESQDSTAGKGWKITESKSSFTYEATKTQNGWVTHSRT